MTDVRLTALNPDDSRVYPVACNSSGELLTTRSSDINLDVTGDLAVGGSITAVGSTEFMGEVTCGPTNTSLFTRNYSGGSPEEVSAFRAQHEGVDKAVIFANGSGQFESYVLSGDVNGIHVAINGASGQAAYYDGTMYKWLLLDTGGAIFDGEVVVGSRGSRWLIRESNGVAMLVEQTRRGAKEPRIVEEVRNLPRELDLIEGALGEIMEKLNMTPPAGWPGWDGAETEQDVNKTQPKTE